MVETEIPPQFDFTIFGPNYEWAEPMGGYVSAEVEWHWNLPGQAVVEIKPDHRLLAYFVQCRRTVIPMRTYYNGEPWDGRLMNVRIQGKPGRERVTLTFVDNKYWLLTVLAWVNPHTPPEFQLALTGKQDLMFGPVDFVFKYFFLRNAIRLDIPCYMGKNLRDHQDQPAQIIDIPNRETLASYANGVDMVVCLARFTQLDDLYKQTLETGEVGIRNRLYVRDLDGPSPEVFRPNSPAIMKEIMDITSDNFFNFEDFNKVKYQIEENAGYVFDTLKKRDKREMVWTTSANLIEYDRSITHATASRVIVGGQAPEVINQLVEFAIDMAIQTIVSLVARVLTLGIVQIPNLGDLFDDIFFAFQEFVDPVLAQELGRHGFKEAFGDNTNAWTIDGFQVGLATLKKHAGSDTIKFSVVSGRGTNFSFGADDDTGNRYNVGDVMSFYDRGTYVENMVTRVVVSDTRSGFMKESVTFGEDKDLKNGWLQVIDRLKEFSTLSKALATVVK